MLFRSPSRTTSPRRVCPASLLGSATCLLVVLGACASSADRQDPLKAELELIRQQEKTRGPVECRPGTQAPCYSGPSERGGRGICVEGVHACGADGYWQVCRGDVQPLAKELCNGKDDDCNGVIDDGFPRADSVCTAGVGECQAQGTYVCRADGTAADCSVRPLPPRAEICDGKDNDCDGQVDEGLSGHDAAGCDTGRPGACRRGHQKCVAGEAICVADTDARHEVCNKIDDDCDGQIDEECVPEK